MSQFLALQTFIRIWSRLDFFCNQSMILTQILFLKNQVYSQRCGGILLEKDACSKSGCVPVHYHWLPLFVGRDLFSANVSLAGYFLVQSTDQDILTRLPSRDRLGRLWSCRWHEGAQEPAHIQSSKSSCFCNPLFMPCFIIDCQVHPKDQVWTYSLFFSILVCPNLLQLESEGRFLNKTESNLHGSTGAGCRATSGLTLHL